jgi:outer membrane protein TolC
MEKQGVLKSEYKANARFFRVNKNYTLYRELKSIILKTTGLGIFLFCLTFSCMPNGFCEDAVTINTTALSSLKEAITIALKNNKDIQIQEQQVKVAKADILGARSEFLPVVDLNAAYTRRGAVLTSTSSAKLKKDYGVFSGYKNDNTAGVSLNQIVYNGGANLANLREKQIQYSEQEETLRAAKLNVELEVKRLYWGLLLAYETKRIAENLVAQAKMHYEEVKKKFEQGTASRFDVLQSKVQASLLIPQLINALNAIDLIMAELNKAMGLKVQDAVVIKDKLDYAPIEIKENEFLRQAYLNKPEMIIKSLGIDFQSWQIKFAKAGWLPQINAAADYSYRSHNTANMFNKFHNNWNVGVAMSIPIFDGFATKAKVDAAKAYYEQAIISKGNLADEIAVSVRQGCLDLRQAQAVIDSQRDNLEDAVEALKISEIRYNNGVGINLDVLDAEVALAQVEQNLANGIYDYLMACASLDRNMGIDYLSVASLPNQEAAIKEAGKK